MARPSKDHPFTIYDDSGIPTPDSGYEPSFDEAVKERLGDWREEADGCAEDGDGGGEEHNGNGEQADDERRRESAFTRTSISSLPESTYQTDNERTHKPYTPPVIRPSFRRPESVRRMQMTSPPPFSSRSPRQSILRHSRSRTGTPQSLRSANAGGSPRIRRRILSEDTQQEEQEDVRRQYPLVLLHVTLLPITLLWSAEAMQELLPRSFRDNLQLLRSKLSDTMLQRGLLIPHPRAEYELLEERLLEALELREERVTKCGHFHKPRGSLVSSTSSAEEGSTDSGLGSSIEGLPSVDEDEDMCTTCQQPIKFTKAGPAAGADSRKWSIKVYAANGLMRASAWTAAWSEMERVDVEILPWISEDVRKSLDLRREEEEHYESQGREEEDERIRAVVEEQVRLAHEQMSWEAEETERRIRDRQDARHHEQTHASANAEKKPPNGLSNPAHTKDVGLSDLPQVYRPSEIPLSVLLRNYVMLLAQDRRNVAIFALAMLLLLFGIRSSASAATLNATTPFEEACVPMQYETHIATLADMIGQNTTLAEVQDAPIKEDGNINVTGLGELVVDGMAGAADEVSESEQGAISDDMTAEQPGLEQEEEREEEMHMLETSVDVDDGPTIPV
ncbi:hypothetical protein LTR36_003491 [Oleoguttula mirabilis]|uniref:Pathway-specific nitrogen regulator n=1 Tax=Oleoguttula mirabilis TaxID=1507867 RepID=A0AAV9JIS1_9PEZI|nr:hypothetical protein LTR36_003491 [Oleoguttula mirabilis]